jgi:hypothetical protein
VPNLCFISLPYYLFGFELQIWIPHSRFPSSYNNAYCVVKSTVLKKFGIHFQLEEDFISLDIIHQLKLIVLKNLKMIIAYHKELYSEQNFDVLSSRIMTERAHLLSMKPIYLHLFISVDGTAMLRTRSLSFWPIQVIVLDLPLQIRQKFENIVLCSLWHGKNEPNFKKMLSKIEKKMLFDIKVDGCCYYFEAKIFLCTFDLPALAKVACLTQYNGQFSCPKCYAPGVTMNSGRGMCRIFPTLENFDLRTDTEWLQHSKLADETHSRIFGLKGFSPILQHIPLPSHLCLDSMHLLFEGISKCILSSLFDSKFHGSLFYLGRAAVSKAIDKSFNSLICPHNFSKFLSPTKNLSFWKAHEFKLATLYIIFPILSMYLPLQYSVHLALYVYIVREAHSGSSHDNVVLHMERCVNMFLKHLPNLYPPELQRINFHLLKHYSEQFKMLGPAHGATMFPFEANNKIFKTFLHGTRCHSNQFVSNFVLYKSLTFYLWQCNSAVAEQFCNVLGISMVNSSKCSTDPVVLDKYRVMRRGIIFHSYDYPHKHNSASYFILTSLIGKEFCKIVSFDGLTVIVHAYKVIANYIDILYHDATADNLSTEMYSIFACSNVPHFVCVDCSNFTVERIDFESIIARCLALDICLNGVTYRVFTPLLEFSEHL